VPAVEDLFVRLGANVGGYLAGMGEATAASGRFDLAQMRAQEHAKAGWAGAATGLAAFGVVGLVATAAVVGFSIKSAANFQTMMERLKTMGGATQAEVNASSGAVLRLATETGFSGTKIAEALYHPISVGYSLKDSLNVARYAAEEAQASGANLDDTMYTLTSTMKSFNLPTTQSFQTMSMLHAIVSQGDQKFQQFNESVKNLMPALGSMGISLQSGGAALDYLTDRGNTAEVASTRLTMGLALMSSPTKQAAKYLSALGLSSSEVTSASAATTAALTKAGLSTTQLSDDLRKPDGIYVALKDLQDHLKKSGVSANEADAIVSKIFGGGRTDKAIVTLLENLDGLKDKFRLIGEHAKDFGQNWKDVQGTFNFQVDQMKARAENFLIALGLRLLPIAAAALKDLGKAFDWLGNHTAVLQALGAALAGVVATGLGIAAVAAWTLLAPFLAIDVPIAAVSVALFELYKHSQAVRDGVRAAINGMRDGITAALSIVRGWIALASAWWDEHRVRITAVASDIGGRILRGLAVAVHWVSEQVRAALAFATEWWKQHGAQVQEAIAYIEAVVKVGIATIVDVFSRAWPYIRIEVQTSWNLIRDIIGGAIRIISDVIGLFIDFLTGHWSRLWGDVTALVRDAFQAIWRIFTDFSAGASQMLVQAGRDIINGLINGIESMGGAVGSAVGNIASSALDAAKGLFGIRSPSTVFHGLGMNIGQGLANGIDASAGLAVSASGRLAAAAIPAVGFNPFAGASSGGSLSGTSGGSSAAGAAGSGPGSGGSGQPIVVQLVLDGRVIAENTLTVLQRLNGRGHVLGLT